MLRTWWQKITSNAFLANSFLLTIAYNLANFINFLANFILVKQFSLDFYGEYSSAIAYVGLIGIPLSILSLVIIQKIGQQPAAQRQQYFAQFERRLLKTLQQCWWLVGLVLMIGFSLLLSWANLSSIVSIFYILATMITTIFSSIYGACLQAEKNFKAYSLTTILAAIIKVAGFFIFTALFPDNLVLIYLILLISNLVTILLQRHFALAGSTQRRSTLQVRPYSWRLILTNREIWLSTLTMLGVMALINLDMILVKKFMTADQAGLYSVLSLFAKTIGYALAPMTQVLFAFGAAQEGERHRQRNLVLTVILFLLAGAAATIIYALFPELLVTIVAKAEYLSIAPLIWLAGIFGTAYALATVLAQYFITLKKRFALTSLIFAILQVVLIYFYHDNFSQLLIIDIIASGLMCLTYLGGFIFFKKNKTTTVSSSC